MQIGVTDATLFSELDYQSRYLVHPEARPNFASRVKTPYNGSFGGRGNKARLSISFPAESEAARLSALAELVQLQKSAGRE
jgi:hypothetical protein